MSNSGCLFDFQKLNDVSKNVLSRMSADEIFEGCLGWAKENDPDFAALLSADPTYAKAIFAIGRGGKKPRKDLATWCDAKPYMGFFYDELFTVEDAYPENFAKNDIKAALEAFLATFDPSDDMTVWFEKIKAVADGLGYASDMKAYKANPEAYPGNVADVSMFLRVALTGKFNSPDMYAVMQVLGKERVAKRIQNMISTL